MVLSDNLMRHFDNHDDTQFILNFNAMLQRMLYLMKYLDQKDLNRGSIVLLIKIDQLFLAQSLLSSSILYLLFHQTYLFFLSYRSSQISSSSWFFLAEVPILIPVPSSTNHAPCDRNHFREPSKPARGTRPTFPRRHRRRTLNFSSQRHPRSGSTVLSHRISLCPIVIGITADRVRRVLFGQYRPRRRRLPVSSSFIAIYINISDA